MIEKNKDVDLLFETLASVKTKEDFKNLFADLCTYKEIESMAQRIKAAKLLLDGTTYEEIIKQTNISSATLSKVSKCVKYGEGYKKILK